MVKSHDSQLDLSFRIFELMMTVNAFDLTGVETGRYPRLHGIPTGGAKYIAQLPAF
jgi:hypothetical protein